MNKTDLIALLEQEQSRVRTRIRRHEDVMTDAQIDELQARVDTLRYAIQNVEKLQNAA